ncbi:MAG: 4-alpha-glucanotransferase [Anaerolineae bacterium]|jgi:4-alpha-glucanotransferase|nr:4-alpha-glucanotransferase [Anaerolineae bacterium]
MKFKRSSGILMHITSLPGPDGIGDLGAEAYQWVNTLSEMGCNLWQVLPLGPTGYADSPYQCFSAFAGNPYLINPAMLWEDGLLTREEVADRPEFPTDHVDYGPVIDHKCKLLDLAYDRFKKMKGTELYDEYKAFKEEESWWLNDFALFMAIKEAHNLASWREWKWPLKVRDEETLKDAKDYLKENIKRHKVRQFLFYRQWRNLRQYANDKGIKIVGDIPIFVAEDSADVWANPELFFMDNQRNPTVVAGVPPDYFSATGQLWGNPLYNWEYHKETGYEWWIKRLKKTFELYDIVRLDHFRGFVAYWEIPAGEETAINGQWKPGPKAHFFAAMKEALGGSLPIIAEDLGEITEDVFELRDDFNLPGMKVMQFAFAGDCTEPFLPHNYEENCVAYTGTHDNDTTISWYKTSSQEFERDNARKYLGVSGDDIAWDMIRAIWSSVADTAIAPLQDFLNLGGEARMNLPGTVGGNWQWRLQPDQLHDFVKARIKTMNDLYNRPDRRKGKYVVNSIGNDESRG